MAKKFKLTLQSGLVVQFAAGSSVDALIEDNTIYVPFMVTADLSQQTTPTATKEQTAPPPAKAKQPVEADVEEDVEDDEEEDMPTLSDLKKLTIEELRAIAKRLQIDLEKIAKEQKIQRWSPKTLSEAIYSAYQEDYEDSEEDDDDEEEVKSTKQAKESPKKQPTKGKLSVQDILQQLISEDIDEEQAYDMLVAHYGEDYADSLEEFINEFEFKSATKAAKALEEWIEQSNSDEEEDEEDEDDADEEEEDDSDEEEDYGTLLPQKNWRTLKAGTVVNVYWSNMEEAYEGEVISQKDKRASDCEDEVTKDSILIFYDADETVSVLDAAIHTVYLIEEE